MSLIETRIKRFIKEYVTKSQVKGVVVGLSGGIDSSTAAALASLALGGDKVLALSMPEKETYNLPDIKHTRMVAEKFNFKIETVDITPILQAFYHSLPIYDEKNTVSKGNIKARARMVCLYYCANNGGLKSCPKLGDRYEQTFNVMIATTLALLTGQAIKEK